jgi:hypothetical protein
MTIVAASTPRQTVPYGDRAFINPENGRLTADAYQYLQRLVLGLSGTITNIGSVITVTNTIEADLTGVQAEITVLQTEITALQVQVGLIDTSAGAAPALPVVPPVTFATACGMAFFFA